MPFVPYNLRAVKSALQKTGHRPSGRSAMATFSCPDLIATKTDLISIFGRFPEKVERRKDADGILRWHKSRKRIPDGVVYDTHSFFAGHGVDVTSFDIFPGRDTEVVHDLCLPVPAQWHGRFDVLFDCISNQCFDPAQVLRNALAVVRVGGVIVHCVPAQMVNQGFYDFGPTLFPDFYGDNGAEVIDQQLVVGVYEETQPRIEPLSYFRMRNLPDDAMNLVTVRKLRDQPYKSPVMRKFRKSPDCKIGRPKHADA